MGDQTSDWPQPRKSMSCGWRLAKPWIRGLTMGKLTVWWMSEVGTFPPLPHSWSPFRTGKVADSVVNSHILKAQAHKIPGLHYLMWICIFLCWKPTGICQGNMIFNSYKPQAELLSLLHWAPWATEFSADYSDVPQVTILAFPKFVPFTSSSPFHSPLLGGKPLLASTLGKYKHKKAHT